MKSELKILLIWFYSYLLHLIVNKLDRQGADYLNVVEELQTELGMKIFPLHATENDGLKDANIFEDTSRTIYKGLKKCHQLNSGKTEICKTAFEIALKQLI